MLYNQLRRIIVIFALIILSVPAWAQTTVISGKVTDKKGAPVPYVNIYFNDNEGTTTDSLGNYNLKIKGSGSKTLIFSHLTYGKHTARIYITSETQRMELNVTLKDNDVLLNQVEVSGTYDEVERKEISRYRIEAVAAKNLPSAFGDFSKVLVTLPGVVSNNELSSSYSVRGGNYDENMVFVNGMPVYRPLIYQSGKQEGLSFVNPDLVQNIDFFAGGWQPAFGDKLSSVLNVEYKTPEAFEGSASLSMLGASAHVGGNNAKGDVNYLAGFRYKNSRNLLNTLDVDGEYAPKFLDFQLLLNKQFNGPSERKPELNFLISYAENDYDVVPKSQQTEFGTFDVPLRLNVAFGGKETLKFRTYQTGLRFTYWLNKRIRSKVLVSGLFSAEREYKDVEGAYLLCLVNKDPGSSEFDECVLNRGVGSNYEHRRNLLDVGGAHIENKYEISVDSKNDIELGWGYSHDRIVDQFNEYEFTDSSDFVTITEKAQLDNALTTNQFYIYGQHHHVLSQKMEVTYGLRSHYHDVTDQLTIDPRIQGAWRPGSNDDVYIRLAAGLYHQPPYYKEFRDPEGNIHTDIKAQSSTHLIGGVDYEFQLWDRSFKLMSEVYYKYFFNVIPFEIENVNIRYLPEQSAKAFAYGVDFRLSGEFIPGDQSWFSMGVLRTRENIEGDGEGYLPRPTDQLLNAAVLFQDHLPGLPDYKVKLNYFYSSPLPFYTPSGDKSSYFRGASYQRVDIGFFKYFDFSNSTNFLSHLKNASLGVEILNMFGINNTITYTWIQDISGNHFATPNTLSQRYFNVKLKVEF